MSLKKTKINPFSKTNPDTGFGVQAGQIGERFINKDGSFNLRKEGWPLLKRLSIYSHLLDLSWLQFLVVILFFYLLINLFFTALYLCVGIDGLQGFVHSSFWGRAKEAFFFSTETFTTVGYGRVNPVGDAVHIIAALEALSGWLGFALVTGLLYGRFTKPQAYIAFSDHALISPYKEGIGLIFRMVPYKINHHITDARVVVNLAVTVEENGIQEFKFYQLGLERSRIDFFTMNWTVVHPIDEESPLYGFTENDWKDTDLELYVQVTGFSPVFSNTVMQRTSYTFKELIWGGKFKPMYRESPNGATTIVELHNLNNYEKIALLKEKV